MTKTPQEPTQDETQQADSGTTPSQAENSDSHMIPKSRFDEVNSKYKELQEQISQMQQEREQAKQQELEEQNKFRELYEQTKRQLDELTGVQEQAQTYRQQLEANNEARIERIPEDKRHLIPDYDDPVKLSAYLDRAIDDLAATGKPKAPSLDGSSGSGGSTNQPALEAGVQQLADIARQYGYQVDDARISDFQRQFTRRPNTGDES